jgi:hypothetical protein
MDRGEPRQAGGVGTDGLTARAFQWGCGTLIAAAAPFAPASMPPNASGLAAARRRGRDSRGRMQFYDKAEAH